MRADGSQVEDLIRKLKDAKMDASVSAEDAKKAATAFASGTKVAIATVADSSGTQQLEVRKVQHDKDKDYYAKSSAVEGVYKVTAELGDGLDKKLDDFRNKKLFDFGFTDPEQGAGRQSRLRQGRRKVDERRRSRWTPHRCRAWWTSCAI